jgi:hypothetical protein
LAKLVELEAPLVDNLCINCQKCPGSYQCLDSQLSQRLLCKDCCVGVHQHNPFHKIQQWTGKFFNCADLENLGLIINFGHDGTLCPQREILETWEDVEDVDIWCDKDNYTMAEEYINTSSTFQTTGPSVTFVDTSGIYQHKVCWCKCSTAASYDLQLLDM